MQMAQGFGMTLDPTRKIARQVGWLNKNAGLVEKLSYSDVVEQLSMLDITEAMRILKDLEQGGPQIPNPTQYVIAAAQQSGANGHYVSGPGQPKYVPMARGPGAVDITGKIQRQVNWLNRNCQLAEPLSYEDLKQTLSALDIACAMAILKEVEERAAEIQSPNAYVLGAAARQGVVDGQLQIGGASQEPGSLAVQLDPSGKIGRQVAWLNKNISLMAPLAYSDIVEPLSKIDVTVAMAILKEVEQGGAQIPDPTAHVYAAAERAALEHGTVPLQPVGGATMDGGVAVALDPTGKIARQVKWLNTNTPLMEQLRFNEVVQPLSMLDIKDAMAILKDLEENSSGVQSPTEYVTAAAERARTTTGAVGAAAMAMGQNPAARRTTASNLNAALQARALGAQGVLDPTGKIARQVRWLNQNVPLTEPLNFEEIVQPLSWLEITAAMSILKDVEKQGAAINKPTAYVLAAANNRGASLAAAGMGPAMGMSPMGMMGGYDMGMGGMGGMGCMGMGGMQGGMDPTGKIARQVTWLNRNAPLAEMLSFDDICAPLSSLDLQMAMKILKDVEEQADNIRSPTKFVLNAVGKIAGGGMGMGMRQPGSLQIVPPMAAQMGMGGMGGIPPPPAGMPMGLGVPVGVAVGIPPPMGMPMATTKRTWTTAAQSADDNELSQNISKMVGRLNKSMPLQEKLSYSDIKEHLERLPLENAIKILKDVEAAPHMIKSPTNYVIAAAKRAFTGESVPKRPRM